MPASITMKFTAAHAEVSARVPKRRTNAQTSVPTTSAVKKHPRRNSRSANGPPPTKSKPNAQVPMAAIKAKTMSPRPTPTSQAPTVTLCVLTGLRNWCFIDLDQMSNSTAYATSSWQTCTADSAMVPTRMNDVIAGVRSRNRVSKPCESMATAGQNVSSNTKKTFRPAMTRSRWAKAQVRAQSARSASACELNEHLLQLRLLHLALADQHRVLVEPPENLRQPLLDGVDRALDTILPHVKLQDAR